MGAYDVESGKYTKLKKAFVVEGGKYVKLPKAYVVEGGKYVKLWSGSGKFVSVSDDMFYDDRSGAHSGSVYTEDGMTWSVGGNPAIDGSIYTSARGNNCIVIASTDTSSGSNKRVAYSKDDGMTWTTVTFTPSTNASSGFGSCNVYFVNGKFRLILGLYNNSNCDRYSSTDGVTWTFEGRKDISPTPNYYSQIVYAKYNGQYRYIMSHNDSAYYSADLLTWTKITWTQYSSYSGIYNLFVVDDTCYLIATTSYDIHVLQLSTSDVSETIMCTVSKRAQYETAFKASGGAASFNKSSNSYLFITYEQYSSYPNYRVYRYDIDSQSIYSPSNMLAFDPVGFCCGEEIIVAFGRTGSYTPYSYEGYYSIDNGKTWTNVGHVFYSNIYSARVHTHYIE